MARFIIARAKFIARSRSFVLLALATATLLSASAAIAQDSAYTYNSEPTAIPGTTPKKAWYTKVGDSWSNGWKATTGAFKKMAPQKKEQVAKNDPVSLAGSKGFANADLHAGMAQMYVEQGRNDMAIRHFQEAFKLEPNNLRAIRGYARFLERQGKPAEAEAQLRRAVKLDRNSAGAWNDLGMCLDQQGKRAEAVQALERAIELQPQKPLYRNNAAAVLVEAGATDRALGHLAQVHGQARAHYNVGYLLAKTGNRQAASDHFRRALQLDSSLVEAEQWIARMNGQSPAAYVAQRPVDVRRPITVSPPTVQAVPPAEPFTPTAAQPWPAPQPRQNLARVDTDQTAADRFWGSSAAPPNAQAPPAQTQFGAPQPHVQQRQVAASPQHSDRQYSAPQNSTPQYGASQYGASQYAAAQQFAPPHNSPAPVHVMPTTPNSAPPTASDQFWGGPPQRPSAQFAPPTNTQAAAAPHASQPAKVLPSSQFQPYQLGTAPQPGPEPRYISDARFAPSPAKNYKSPLKFGKQGSSYEPPLSRDYQ